jgi:lipid II:glycine glycyltransferase (peptidoglycan interpeptide bridge formation enzyme)
MKAVEMEFAGQTQSARVRSSVVQGTRTQSVVISHGENVDQWDQFLSQCPHAHIEQSRGWVDIKKIYGWSPTWIWVTRNGEIVGGSVVLTRRINALVSIAYVERGPIWQPGDRETMETLLKAIHDFASSRHIAYLVVAPPYFGSDAIPVLESLHFRAKPNAFPPTGVGRATLLIDLSQSQEALLAAMSMTKRQNLRRAVRKGVKVRLGTAADADVMRELMWAACQRRGIAPVPSQRGYFENLWQSLGTKGNMQFFVAEIEGQPVAAATAFLSGERLELWRVGWAGTHDDFNPNDLLHWEMIKWAKENGCRFFDFLHIEPEHARAILRGERVTGWYSGVTEFKTSFGGQIHLLPDLHYRSFYPVAGMAFQLGAARMVESAPFQFAFNRVSSRIMKWKPN